MKNINPKVFLPPLLLIVVTILFSQFNHQLFSEYITTANQWVLKNFGFLFSWSSFAFIVLLGITYFSPIAKMKIGGERALPLLSKPKWFAISICTTIATGILFWGCAEPLFHYSTPPVNTASPNTQESMNFAISTMYMHWSFTPYAIYCLAGLVFALSFYNRRQKFSVSSLLGVKGKTIHTIADIICLYALVLGMSASLGTGIYSLIGGIKEVFAIPKSNFLIALVGLAIAISFTVSAVSGLQKGIKWLSTVNIIGFILLLIHILLFGYPSEIIKIAWGGLQEYVTHFFQRSLNVDASIDKAWLNDWSIFYWANWFAWAPVTALFLGKISRGYTIRQYINFNLIFPSIFAIVWMSVFSGTTLHINAIQENSVYQLMKANGEESVMYHILHQLKYGSITIPVTLFLIFLSYVTAADSNISAMSAMSEKVGKDSNESHTAIKIIWGVVIGALTYIMLSTKGLDGIRILSVLGGFPVVFILLLATISLIRILLNRKLIDQEK